MYQSLSRFLIIVFLLAIGILRVNGQASMPEELNKSRLKDQLKYLDERTRIYENYRAIREDMFQKVKSNVTDTLNAAMAKISGLSHSLTAKTQIIDSLNNNLEKTKASLEEMTGTKNSIKVLGIEVNKITYNSIMWIIIGGLVLLLAIGYLIFKRNLSLLSNTNKDFKDLKEEFEAYRKTTREAREKMSMDHFKEVQKLKGG